MPVAFFECRSGGRRVTGGCEDEARKLLALLAAALRDDPHLSCADVGVVAACPEQVQLLRHLWRTWYCESCSNTRRDGCCEEEDAREARRESLLGMGAVERLDLRDESRDDARALLEIGAVERFQGRETLGVRFSSSTRVSRRTPFFLSPVSATI